MSAQTLPGLHYARCGNCHAAFLIEEAARSPECPNCFAGRLVIQSDSLFDAPAELAVMFAVPPASLTPALERWRRGTWFLPPEARADALAARATRVYLSMWLVDAMVQGTWQAQMGFDYLVASTEERYDGAGWSTKRLNETRVRWEARAGEITRRINNVAVPALNDHARIMTLLGATEWQAPPFDSSRAAALTENTLGGTLIRSPEIAPGAAWSSARDGFEKHAAADCMSAANAQHYQEFRMRAEYEGQNWSLLLLPIYASAYHADDGKVIAVLINGQNGVVSGNKVASMQRARRASLALGVAALLCFAATLVAGLASISSSTLIGLALFLLLATVSLGLVAGVPMLYVWQHNQRVGIKTGG